MNRILHNKLYLYLTEFMSGIAVMAVELGASRLLAPYFSSSQIVWTIIIGTIMIAMALGNVYGGRTADRDNDPDRLYGRLLVAAVWIAAIPVVGKFIIIGVSGLLAITVSTGFLTLAAFISCMIIFVFPLFLLGTVTPSLVKFATDSLASNGKTVGTLGAANTIGSIIGTFLPTFVTIPAVGTAVTFLIFSACLLALAVIYFISEKKRLRSVIVSVAIYILCAILGTTTGFAFWEKDLSYEGESIYNYLQVKEDENNIILSTNVLFGVQSVAMKTDDLTGMYYDYALAAPLMAGLSEDSSGDVLILGNGTGTYAAECRRYFPNLNITGVEIDEKISELATDYFDADPETSVITYDGRAYLAASKKKYDVIMVDAYQDITIPFQMSSVEFFTMVRKHLKDSGVMVVNMNMRSTTPNGINDYLSDTIASVFPAVCMVDVDGYTNRELFAADTENAFFKATSSLSSIKNRPLQDLMSTVMKNVFPYEGQDRILTDDRAGVELLGMRAIDEIIASELSYYKGILKEDGIKGLLKEI